MAITIGQAIWASVKPIIKIFLIIATGALLSKLALLSVETTRAISDVVLAVLLPCLAFSKIVSELEARDAKAVGIVAISAVLVYATGLGMAYIVRRLLPCPKQWNGGILAGGMFPNISDLPIAYLQTMDTFVFTPEEAQRGIACVIIFLATFLICVFNLGGFRLIEHDFQYVDEESQSFSTSSSIVKETPSNDEEEDEDEDEDEYSRIDSTYTLDTALTSLAPTHTRSTAVSSLPSMSNAPSIQTPVQVYSETGSTCSSCQGSTSYSTSSSLAAMRRRSDSTNTLHSIRSLDQRTVLPLQGIPDVINEYSNVDQFGKERHLSSVSEASMPTIDEKMTFMERIRSARLTRMVTSDATVSKKDIDISGDKVLPNFITKLPGSHLLMFFLTNCLRPCSVAVFAGLFIAFIPWLKALFVTSKHTPYVGLAPDKQPVLSFVIDFTEYLGAASVPFGLLLLGATLGRLKIENLYPGFWKTTVVLIILKLCIMPIFGVLWCDRLVKAGWCNWEDDKMLLFVISITWGLPTMTTLIYFTASYTPPGAMDHVQIDCASFFIMLQYPLLILSLPFLVTYMLMVQLNV